MPAGVADVRAFFDFLRPVPPPRQGHGGLPWSMETCVLFSAENTQTNNLIRFMAGVNNHGFEEERERLGYQAGRTYTTHHDELRVVEFYTRLYFEGLVFFFTVNSGDIKFNMTGRHTASVIFIKS